MLPTDWRFRRIGEFLTESRIPGTDGSRASKLSVKLYGKGVVPKQDSRPGSENTKYYIRRAGQFIYSKLDFLNGAFGIIPEELDGYESTLDLPAFDISGDIDARWLLSFVCRDQFYSAQEGSAKGGRKARRVAPDEFLRLEIPVPPLSEQRKITVILGSMDEAIQATQAVIEQTSTVKQGLLQELLSRGIGHTRFKQTEIGEVPEGWVVAPIGSLCAFSGGNGFGAADWSDAGLPIIRIQNLNGSRDFNYYSGPLQDRWIVEPGELLFAWAGVKGVSFGPCLWQGPRGVLNQHIYRITPHSHVDKTWLFEAFGQVTRQIEAHAHGFKASLLHVRKADITDAMVGVPGPKEQAHIAARASDLRHTVVQQENYLRSLEALRNGIMQNLLTGQIRVAGD